MGIGIEPKIVTESEPISEVTKIAQPVGTKNVTGTQINPATEDTLSDVKAGVGRNFYLMMKDDTVASTENFFISSGMELGARNLKISGVYVCRGYTQARWVGIDGGKFIIDGGILTINGGLV